MIKKMVLLLASTALSINTTLAEDQLKYFVIQGKAKPEMIRKLVENPLDPWPNAEKMISGIKGAKLIDYYLELGSAQNLAIIAVPDSKYAAAITYQRMGTLFMEDMKVFEVIPSTKVKEILKTAKDLNTNDAYLK